MPKIEVDNHIEQLSNMELLCVYQYYSGKGKNITEEDKYAKDKAFNEILKRMDKDNSTVSE